MKLAIFLYIVSYLVGMSAQTNNQHFIVKGKKDGINDMYESEGYNWFYPITNGFNWALRVITSLFVLICCCIGLRYHIKKKSILGNDCIENIFTYVLGSIFMTIMTTFVYFFLIYLSFGLVIDGSTLSILIGFTGMLFCNLNMGYISKLFNKYKKIYEF